MARVKNKSASAQGTAKRTSASAGGETAQPRSPSAIRIRRAQLGRVLGYIGGAGIMAVIVALIWGGGIAPDGATNVPVWVAGAVAVFGFGAWFAFDRAGLIGFITGRDVRFSTVAIFSTLLLIGIVVLTYGVVLRATLTLDMTQTLRFTLSSETLTTLERVERPMRITGFYTPRLLPTRELDDQIIRLYETATAGRIDVQYIDPEEQPALAQAFGVTEDAQIFLSAVDDAGEIVPGTTARIPRGDNIEREVTNAISRLLIAGSITVYFEISLSGRDPLDTGAEGISGINNGIRESGLVTAPLNLLAIADAGEDIPADAATIIFPRPLRDLRPVEIDVIDRYLQRGGSLLLLADATFNADPFMAGAGAFNTYLWDRYGIRARDLVVVDPAASGDTALDVISAFVFSDNPIGGRIDPSANRPTLFRIARAVEVDLTRPFENQANGQVILSSEASYGETDFAALAQTNTYTFDPAVDVPGPLSTVVWANDLTTGARIVLVGDSDFVTNGQVLAGSNGLLFTDSLSWLSGLDERVTFAPQAIGASLPLIFISTQTINLIGLGVIVVVPGLVLLAGIVIWARRSRRAAL